MREAWLPHVARRLAACALFAFSVVLYQGCSDAPEDPYAALDAKFPAGRPPLADAQTRAQDADYQKKIQEGGRRYLTLNAAAEKAEHEADRFRTVYREALTKRMKQAGKLLAENKKNEFYDEVLKALWGYIGDKLNIPVSLLSKDNVEAELVKYGVSGDLIKEFIAALNECEFARYAPGNESEAMDKVYAASVDIISKMENNIKH